MGQRLVIEFFKGKERIAAAYFHWSGYTRDAAYIMADFCKAANEGTKLDLLGIVDCLKEAKGYKPKVVLSMEAKEDPKFKEIIEKYPMQDYLDEEPNPVYGEPELNRTEGLILLTDELMEDFVNNGEEFVSVDIEAKTVCFSVLHRTTKEDYLKEYPDADLSACTPYINMDESLILFEKFGEFTDFITKNPKEYTFIDGNEVIHIIA